VKNIDQVEASPTYTKDTVILITEDEGGGYYDSGYVQPDTFRISTRTMSRFPSSSSATASGGRRAPMRR